MENKGNKNAYICSNLHSTVTEYADSGVTPMFISCPICKEMSTSMMGRVNQSIEATHEWYKPANTLDEITKFAHDEISKVMKPEDDHFNGAVQGVINHIVQGGLWMREKKHSTFMLVLDEHDLGIAMICVKPADESMPISEVILPVHFSNMSEGDASKRKELLKHICSVMNNHFKSVIK